LGCEDAPKALADLARSFFSSPTMFYSGVPIVVEGQTMGAFCILATNRPSNYDAVQGAKEQEEMAKRMTAVLQHQLQHKRVAAAQQAMMQQQQAMMQQQMQQQMLMMQQQQIFFMQHTGGGYP